MTRYVDIIEPTLFTDYMRESTPEKYIMLMESGMLAAPPEQVTKVFYAGGWDINMPEWNDLARGEGHAPNDNPAQQLTPDKIDSKKMIGRRHFIGQAWHSMDMAGYVATGNPKDPMRAIADGIQNWWYYLIERRIAATLNGIAADNAANDGGDMIVDLYADSATPAAANKVSGDAIIEAEMTLGDQHTALTTIMMHSAAYKDLKKQDMIEFEKPSDAKMRIPYYQEKQVLVSDIMPVFAGTNAAKYRMALVGSGVFSFIDDVPSEPILDTQDAQYTWNSSEWRRFTFPNETGFKFYRFRFTEGGGRNSDNTAIGQMVMHQIAREQAPVGLTATSGTGINRGAGFVASDIGRHVRMKGSDGGWRFRRINL